MTRVLVVDDEPGLRQSLGLLLADAGYEVASEGNGTRALERALGESFDVVLCDVRMPGMDGLAFLRGYKGRGGSGLVIMMSAYGGEEAALAAMKEGAYDYVPKPFRPDEVVLTLRKAEERERLGHTIATLRAQLDSSPAARALIAESPAMREALDMVARVAGHPTTVLITGERGTGKEVVAQAIHRASPRAAPSGARGGPTLRRVRPGHSSTWRIPDRACHPRTVGRSSNRSTPPRSRAGERDSASPSSPAPCTTWGGWCGWTRRGREGRRLRCSSRRRNEPKRNAERGIRNAEQANRRLS